MEVNVSPDRKTSVCDLLDVKNRILGCCVLHLLCQGSILFHTPCITNVQICPSAPPLGCRFKLLPIKLTEALKPLKRTVADCLCVLYEIPVGVYQCSFPSVQYVSQCCGYGFAMILVRKKNAIFLNSKMIPPFCSVAKSV